MRHTAFTIVEMLVALAVTLIMMLAVVTLFGVITDSVAQSRAGIEMSDRMRAARNQIQRDLQGVTATMRPPLRPEDDAGYFEIIEGPEKDYTPGQADAKLQLFGDIDDVLMFTTRSRGAPFRGKVNGALVESPVAEVAYFLSQDVNSPPPVIDATLDPPVRLYTLYRRHLLISPSSGPFGLPEPHFYDDNDISARHDPLGSAMVANTLGDLTKRENRFGHYGIKTVDPPIDIDYGVFPHPVDLTAIPIPLTPMAAPSFQTPDMWPTDRPTEHAYVAPLEDERTGDDILLGNVLSFDVQMFDRGAPVFVTANIVVEPKDPAWEAEARTWVADGRLPADAASFGAYVDLGYGHSLSPPLDIQSQFDGQATLRSGLRGTHYVYDTWSLHYEADGVDQNGDTQTDAGTDGIDNPVAGVVGVVDDLGEFDTLPPYPSPLRGIKITIRVYEPSSKQVREAVVIQEFAGS